MWKLLEFQFELHVSVIGWLYKPFPSGLGKVALHNPLIQTMLHGLGFNK